MRRLILMRHGKSAWDSPALCDHARPLERRGERSGKLMGRALLERGWVPDVILTSDARRAEATANFLQAELRDPPVERVPELYLGGPYELGRAARRISQGASTVLMVGHNPGLEDGIQHLSGVDVTVKTADAVLLASSELADLSWAAVIQETGRFSLEGTIRSRALLAAAKTASKAALVQ